MSEVQSFQSVTQSLSQALNPALSDTVSNATSSNTGNTGVHILPSPNNSGIYGHHRCHGRPRVCTPPHQPPVSTPPADNNSLVNLINEKFQSLMNYMSEMVTKLLQAISALTQPVTNPGTPKDPPPTTTPPVSGSDANGATAAAQNATYVDPESETGVQDNTEMGAIAQPTPGNAVQVTDVGTTADDTVQTKEIPVLKKLAGFLWKPESDKDGNLAVLLPPNLTGKVKRVEVQDADGKVIGRGKASGVGNGGRTHFRFNKKGSAYPTECKVVITLNNGEQRVVKIKDPAQRLEKK